jgi:PAS domain S-box-containing protein
MNAIDTVIDTVIDTGPESLVLSRCAREPIHSPGAIQPHGAVLVALAESGLITHASANLASILGLAAEGVLGRPLAAAVGPMAGHELLKADISDGAHRAVMQATAGQDGAALDLRSHRADRHICVDIEPISSEPWQRPGIAAAQSVLATFDDARSQVELCDRAVRGLKAITGYDRVMAYRFAGDGHGEVIAEALEAGFAPYLGQHYPASDIPPQARRQYLMQRVGVIGNSAYQPVPLLADPERDDGTPLDLTRSALRSVSPVHRRYMRNMGTAASLTIGLTQGHDPQGQNGGPHVLWGMLVCHHAVPRVAGRDVRMIAGMIGQVISLLLAGMGTTEVYARRVERNLTLRAISDRLAAPAPLVETLEAMSAELLHLVDATGAVLRMGGTLVCLGRTPAPAAAERALAALHPVLGGEIVAVDDLGLRYPSLAAYGREASGALMVPLAEGVDDAILWFRPEQASTIVWAGNPAEHAMSDPLTGELSPRISFNAWKEDVRGRAAPWGEAELAAARALRHVVEAEAARRTKAALALFDQLFQSSPTALVLTGQDGDIRFLNRPAERMFGYRHAELNGLAMDRLFPDRFRKSYADYCRQFLANTPAGPARERLELCGLRHDGTEFPLEIGLCVIDPIDVAAVPMLQVDIVDLTQRHAVEREKLEVEQERQQKRRELERSNADLEEFSYAVSHDLKAPLRAIGHLAQWIGEDIATTASEDTLGNIKLLQDRVVRMQKLLEGLLEYSCLARSDKSVETVDMVELVRDIVAMLAPPPDFAVVFEGETHFLCTERAAIQMVLENLIGNGLKHHDRAEGRIVVSMRMAGGVAEIRVADDGPGIPPQFHQRIFAIFQTLKSRDDVEASGIGLAIVKRKVETHGGRIWIESAPPARGATFALTWNETAP